MISPRDVSACLVTRGDQPDMIARILDSLIDYDEVIVWNNAEREDFKTAGRFAAMAEARNEVCYTQDDDCIVPAETQRALLAAYEPGVITSNYGHYPEEGAYGDLPLPCGGALYPRPQVEAAVDRYIDHYQFWGPHEDAYADFLVGVLTPFKQIRMPFEIVMDVAQGPERLCNQEWAATAKEQVTNRARAIRDA